ncbi:MAG: carboxy terminal-processing peptidase [Bdellovibrionales bacterium]|nr:carboxy terminal-processing peptidase [Bdellovibrionales bacterium]
MGSFKGIASLVLAGSFLFLTSNSYAQGKDDLECRYLSAIEGGFLANHIRYANRDAELANHTVEQYIKRIDPSKIYLLSTDIDQIKGWMSNLFEKTKNKDCAFLTETQKLLVKRAEERAAFAKTFLGKDYKFDPKTEFTFDPDKKPFPKNTDEANDFMKKYIHFQIANYQATDMKMDEAKKNVIKTYDRAVKRLQDTKETDLYSDYLDSFARALDPHSSFFSRDSLEDFEIQMRLSLEGIGATLSSQDGFTVVEQLVPGGAAAKSGLIEPQDKIIAVGQEKGAMENVIDMDLKDVVKKIRGAKGTKVRLTILRKKGESKQRLDVSLTREKVNLEDEAASIIYQDKEINGKKKKIGIINFPSFYADSRRGGRSSAADLKKIIKEANEKKVDGLVLDLSNNGGGSLEDAVKIAGLFFKTGNVVKQSSRDASRGEQTLSDTDPAVDWAGPLVLLTSRISASASEIVAGTLQDYKRAVIVGGDHTFGKGSVQSVLPMPNNLGALKVTVGMFFVPGGNSTQHRGVEADVVLPGPYSTDDIGEKFLDYSLPPQKIAPFLSPEAYVKEGPGAWSMLKPEWIKSLREKSVARVEKSEDFKKIEDELKKAKARGKLIKVSEVLKDKNETKNKKEKEKVARYGNKDQKNKEYLKRPDINEATNVLMDLMESEAAQPTGKQAAN